MTATPDPIFWCDARLPHVELRKVADGRQVCYAPHSHREWSLGAITAGCSTFDYRGQRHDMKAGDLVLINPDWVHNCNPIDNQPWSYLMLYVDTHWLTRLRHDLDQLPTPAWQDLATATLDDPGLYQGFCELADTLLDPDRELLAKQDRLVDYLTHLLARVAAAPSPAPVKVPPRIGELAAYLDQHCTDDLSLDVLCQQAGCSPGYLIRAFRQAFGLTPHAYLVNRRIQLGRQQLRQGLPIAEAALNAGFSDQPHFQRTFKRLVAATPNQYRRQTSSVGASDS